MTAEEIKRQRILVSLWAYAYEVKNDSLVSDSKYDAVSSSLDYTTKTGNFELDEFFRTKYSKDTAMWILEHPHLKTKLPALYEKIKLMQEMWGVTF